MTYSAEATPSPELEPTAASRAVALLTDGQRANELINLTLRSSNLQLINAKLHDLQVRPGGVATAVFITTTAPLDNPSAENLRMTVCVSTETFAPSPHLVTLESADLNLSAWVYPYDPDLPAIELSHNPTWLAELLAPYGVLNPDSLQTLGYRALRRAVLSAKVGERTVFMKVVRPKKVQQVLSRHELGAHLGVVPPVAWHEAGLVALAAAPGVSLASYFASQRGSLGQFRVHALVDHLHRAQRGSAELRLLTQTSSLEIPAANRPVARLTQYRQSIVEKFPDLAVPVDELLGELWPRFSQLPSPPLGLIHGDFNVANIFVDPRDASFNALIDADALGLGILEEDLATLSAHIFALADLAPAQYPSGAQTAQQVLLDLLVHPELSPEYLAWAVPATLITLIPGAPSSQVAAAWLGIAQRLSKY